MDASHARSDEILASLLELRRPEMYSQRGESRDLVFERLRRFLDVFTAPIDGLCVGV